MSSRTEKKTTVRLYSHQWRVHELRKVLYAGGQVDWPDLPWPKSDRDTQVQFVSDYVTGEPAVCLVWFTEETS